MAAANSVPLITAYKMGKFDLSHRSVSFIPLKIPLGVDKRSIIWRAVLQPFVCDMMLRKDKIFFVFRP